MELTYNMSRNSSDETVDKIEKQLNTISGIKVSHKYISLFKTELYITIEKEITPNELLALGALIGTIEANQYID